MCPVPCLPCYCGAGLVQRRRYPAMAHPIAIGGVHHLRLTVTDVNRSRAFYTSLLGLDVAAAMPPARDPWSDAVNAIPCRGAALPKAARRLARRPVAPQGD